MPVDVPLNCFDHKEQFQKVVEGEKAFAQAFFSSVELSLSFHDLFSRLQKTDDVIRREEFHSHVDTSRDEAIRFIVRLEQGDENVRKAFGTNDDSRKHGPSEAQMARILLFFFFATKSFSLRKDLRRYNPFAWYAYASWAHDSLYWNVCGLRACVLRRDSEWDSKLWRVTWRVLGYNAAHKQHGSALRRLRPSPQSRTLVEEHNIRLTAAERCRTQFFMDYFVGMPLVTEKLYESFVPLLKTRSDLPDDFDSMVDGTIEVTKGLQLIPGEVALYTPRNVARHATFFLAATDETGSYLMYFNPHGHENMSEAEDAGLEELRNELDILQSRLFLLPSNALMPWSGPQFKEHENIHAVDYAFGNFLGFCASWCVAVAALFQSAFVRTKNVVEAAEEVREAFLGLRGASRDFLEEYMANRFLSNDELMKSVDFDKDMFEDLWRGTPTVDIHRADDLKSLLTTFIRMDISSCAELAVGGDPHGVARRNATTAADTSRILRDEGFDIPPEVVERFYEKDQWHSRCFFSVLSRIVSCKALQVSKTTERPVKRRKRATPDEAGALEDLDVYALEADAPQAPNVCFWCSEDISPDGSYCGCTCPNCHELTNRTTHECGCDKSPEELAKAVKNAEVMDEILGQL